MLDSNIDKIQFAFIGDLCLGGEYITYRKKKPRDYLTVFRQVLPILRDADILVVNLEGPLFRSNNQRRNVGTVLDNDLRILDMLNELQCVVLNLANNHIMDYGEESLKQTIEVCRARNIQVVGAGINRSEAEKALFIQCKGKRIGFLGFSSDEPHVGSICASTEKAGCATYLDYTRLITAVRKMRATADIACVMLHWGYEYFSYPSPEQRRLATILQKEGIDYIIGHHPHVVQGVERIGTCCTMYSLGNFFLPLSDQPKVVCRFGKKNRSFI